MSLVAAPTQSHLRGITRGRIIQIVKKDYKSFDAFFEMAEALGGSEGLAAIQQIVFWNEHLLFIPSIKMCCIVAGVPPDVVYRISGSSFMVKNLQKRFYSWKMSEKIALKKLCESFDLDWLKADSIIARDVKWRNLARSDKPKETTVRPEELRSDHSKAVRGADEPGLREGADSPDLDLPGGGEEDGGRILA